MINPLLDMLESVAMIPGFSWVYKYAAKLRGAQTEVRDRKQRAEELQDRGKRAAGSAKNVTGKKKEAPKAGAPAAGGARLRGASASNRKRAGVASPQEPPAVSGANGKRDRGAKSHPPARGGDGFAEPSYTPPPTRDRLRRRPRPGDDE